MKAIPTKDALEIWSLAQFKAAWIALGFSQKIPAGGAQMPRRQYAASFAAVIAQFMQEYEADTTTAVFLVVQTVLGNASQLGAKLTKKPETGDAWLQEAEASQTADALLTALQARVAAQAAPNA